jgi:hypothetical protein
VLGLLLALPALQGQDPPKDEKKPTSAKEQFNALVKEYAAQQQKIIADYEKTSDEADKQKLVEKYRGLGKEFAEKVYKVAEDHPKDTVAADALFWVVQNGAGSPVHEKATEQVTALIGEMPLKDLTRRLNTVRGGSPAIFEAAVKRAEKDEKDPQAAELLAWVATSGSFLPAGQTAAERLIEKYPDHDAVERVVRTLARGPKGEDALKQLLEKEGTKPRVKAVAALALGETAATRADRTRDQAEADKVAAEAEKYLTRAIDLGKDNEAAKKEAERLLNALRTLRVGKEAPEIKAEDLDGKEFKLSDYRGKVVLLDFWGDW